MSVSAELVWIENTQPRLFHLPDRVKKVLDPMTNACVSVSGIGSGHPVPPSASRTAEGKKKNVKGRPTLTALDAEYWKFASANEQVKVWLKKGWLKVHESDSPDVDHTPTLEPFNEKTAITVVQAEDNADLLQAWLHDEKRDMVTEALRARLVVIHKAKAAAQPQSSKKG